jgi:glycosyltransferase involved in cell wall biosynthesis
VFARLRRDWPGARLHIIGGGPEEQALRVAAQPLGDAVVVHGYVDDERKSALLTEAWLNVTLSDGEGWGLAVIEAAAHGVPTLCRTVDGLCDSVRHKETGWLVPDGQDVAVTLGEVLRLLSDPGAADEMADACRAWAARFDWASSGRRFTTLVADLLEVLEEGRASGLVSQEDLCDVL